MTTLAAYNYTLDTVGNRTRVDELGGDYTTWGYDNQYRLTNETIHDGGNTISSSYTYDDVGNRTSQTVNGQATTYSYNALDQMTQSVTGGVTTTYAYDGRGNLATTTTGSDVTTYSWDALDRLTTVDVPAGADSAYTYDPTGYRVRQTLGSDTTNYLWDEFSVYGDVVRETNGTGTELASYTLANTQLVAQVRGGVASYYVQDGQGSTRALTNATGDITDTYNYLAYGQLYGQTGTTTNSYLYTGQQFDSATGLYDLRARYYDPSVGRFVSRDTYPINYQNPIELNRYGYAANNPINRYDPSGNLAIETALNNALSGQREGTKLGALAGFVGSVVFLVLAALSKCGTELYDWLYKDLGLEGAMEFVGKATATGAILGGFAGMLAALTPAMAAAIGVLGIAAFYDKYSKTTDEDYMCHLWSDAAAVTTAFAGGGGFSWTGGNVGFATAGGGMFSGGFGAFGGVSVGASAAAAGIFGNFGTPWSGGNHDDNDDDDNNNDDSDEPEDDIQDNGDEATNTLPPVDYIDPWEVRFSQDSCSYYFKNGTTIDDLANGLRSGEVNPSEVPAIRLVEQSGKLYTLDNRRLEAFRRADIQVPYRMATPNEIIDEAWKFTTQNDGVSIRVRGQP